MKRTATLSSKSSCNASPTSGRQYPVILAVLAFSFGASTFSMPGSAAQEEGGLVADPRTPYFHLESDRAVGDRGEISLDVSTPGQHCGRRLVFERAEIEVLRNRFGDVQFVALPQQGCEVCSPLVVRWMHEPTGHLEFNVNVYRRDSATPCPEDQ